MDHDRAIVTGGATNQMLESVAPPILAGPRAQLTDAPAFSSDGLARRWIKCVALSDVSVPDQNLSDDPIMNLDQPSMGGTMHAYMRPRTSLFPLIGYPQGLQKPFNGCSMVLVASEIEAAASASGRSGAPVDIFVSNALAHQLYHCAGLGDSASNNLMQANPSEVWYTAYLLPDSWSPLQTSSPEPWGGAVARGRGLTIPCLAAPVSITGAS